MSRRYGLLVAAVALVLIVALVALPNKAGAQVTGHCPSDGIVPGSVTVISTDYGAGQVAGNTIRFQLCGGIGEAVDAPGTNSTLKIGLLWEIGGQHSWWKRDQYRFLLINPAAAGITLRATDNAKVWPATDKLSESADPQRLFHVYSTSSSHGYGYRNFHGVTVDFGPTDLLEGLYASGDLPITLQFNVPVSAGMSNPEHIGQYSWLIVLYHDFINSCEAKFASTTSTKVPAYIPGELQLFPKSGGPGTAITVVGNGFPGQAPVRLVKIGPFTLPRFPPIVRIEDPATITDSLGAFNFEVVMPGFDTGQVPIEVQVDGNMVGAEFTLTNSASYTPVPYRHRISEGVAALEDNFVRAFYYDVAACHWAYYDREFPDESDLPYFISGETFWLLVKEPQIVILNRDTRSLTCTPEGNCWNQIVW